MAVGDTLFSSRRQLIAKEAVLFVPLRVSLRYRPSSEIAIILPSNMEDGEICCHFHRVPELVLAAELYSPSTAFDPLQANFIT